MCIPVNLMQLSHHPETSHMHSEHFLFFFFNKMPYEHACIYLPLIGFNKYQSVKLLFGTLG